MSSQSLIEITDITPLKDGESQYIKPYRIHFKRKGQTRLFAWDCIKTHDSVAVLLYNSSRKKLIFVRQFRPPVYICVVNQGSKELDFNAIKEKSKTIDEKYGYTLELCAGVIDKDGLSPAEIAREEIVEETGYDPPIGSVEAVTSFRTGVGHTGALQYLFYCQVDDTMQVSDGGGIDDESIEVVELSIEESKKYLYPPVDQLQAPTPAGLRVAIGWFIYEKYPTLKGK